MATEKVKTLKLDTDPAQKSVKELRKELKGLKDELLSLDKGTEQYNETLRKAADIQHTLKEQMEEVNAVAMDFGQIASNCTKAVGGLVAGFQAANAVMNLFGIENEEVLKSLKKMQNLMALTQALPAIDNSIKAFRRLSIAIKGAAASMTTLSKALVATGIGAAIAAVGYLAANWDKVSDALHRWGLLHEDTKKKLEEQAKLNKELAEAVAEADGKYEEWERKQKVSKLNDEAKKKHEEATDALAGYQLQLDKIVAKQKEEDGERRKGWKERWDALNEEGLQLLQNIKILKDQQNAILANADSYKKVDKAAEDAAKKLREELQKIMVDLETARVEAEALLNPDSKKVYSQWEIAIKPNIVIEESEEELDDAATQLGDQIRERIMQTVNSISIETDNLKELYLQQQNDLDLAYRTGLIQQQEYQKKSEMLAKQYKENMRAQAGEIVAVFGNILGSLGSVFDSIASTIDQGTEEGQRKYKALMYTSTIISTLAGVAGAISSAFMPVNSGMTIWGQIAMAATTSASVLASGIAQLVQIKNAGSNSSLGGSSAMSQPSTTAMNTVTAPVQYTQDVQGASIESAISNSRVYVVESDISNTQRRVSVTESESKF